MDCKNCTAKDCRFYQPPTDHVCDLCDCEVQRCRRYEKVDDANQLTLDFSEN